jgi:hypothetical protein
MGECFPELEDRRAESLKPWLEERFRPFRPADSAEDAAITAASQAAPEARTPLGIGATGPPERTESPRNFRRRLSQES